MFNSKPDAIDLLKADHREVEKLFSEFEKAEDDAIRQAALASEIGQALSIHAELEETLLYPRILNAMGEDQGMVCEAVVEHGSLRGLIAGMNGKSPQDPMIKARVDVLKEYVQHHVKEEEHELFPKVRKLDLDLQALADDMTTLKAALQKQVGKSNAGATIHVVEVSTKRRRAA